MACPTVTLCDPDDPTIEVGVSNAGTAHATGKIVSSGDPYLGDLTKLVECPNPTQTAFNSLTVEQAAQDARLDALEADQIVQDTTVTTLTANTNTTFTQVAVDQATQDARLNALETTVASDMTFKGGYDAAANVPDLDTDPAALAAIEVGDTYKVTVAGVFYGETLNPGDAIIADQTNPTTLGDWLIIRDSAGTAAALADLQSQITSNDADIAVLQAADVALQSNIDTEAATRAADDATLQTNVNNEASNRAAGDAALAADIATNATNIASNDGDITALQAADAALQTSINNEAATRAADDAANAAAIAAETTNRTNADTTHTTDIAALQAENATQATQIANLQATVTGGVSLKGGYDPVANAPDLPGGTGTDNGDGNGTTITTGDLYKITADGTFFGQPVVDGDSITAIVDNPTTAADWIITRDNTGEATETTLGTTQYATDAEVIAGTATNRAITPAGLKNSGVLRGASTVIGNGTDTVYPWQHDLDSNAIVSVKIIDNTTGVITDASYVRDDSNNITVTLEDIAQTNQYDLTIGVL